MSSFTLPLVVTPLDDGRRWKLVHSFEYHVGEYPSDDVIVVPSGFVTDFASVPRIFWWLLPPTGRYGKAAVVHDYLYVERERSRKECDRIFYEGMRVLSVNARRAYIMWLAVRIGGGPGLFREWK